MLDSPSVRESNVMSLPSGDQHGDPVLSAPKAVSCTGFVPSASDIQTSSLPERFDENAIWLPSGEYLGEICSREEVTILWARAVGSERSRRQILMFVRLWANASRFPTGLTERSEASCPTGSFS